MKSPSTRRWPASVIHARRAEPLVDRQGPGGSALPLVSPFALTSLVDGRCGCSYHRAEAQRDHELRDQALATIVYQVGVDVLRQRALDRVPAFQAAFDG